jgi:hypothetical protein
VPMTLTDPVQKARQHVERNSTRPKSQFPIPHRAVVRDGKGKNCWKFFKYWKELTAAMDAVNEIRVYRCWPVIDLKVIEPGRRNIVFDFLEGECPVEDPYEYDKWFLERYGAGDWKLVIMEKGITGGLMTALFAARGLGGGEDLDTYPPKLDYRTVTNCEENRTFIDWCRRNGKTLPWDGQEIEGDDFMSVTAAGTPAPAQATAHSAIGEVFKSMAQAHTDMAKAAIEGAKDSADIRVRLAESRGPDPQATATTEAIKLITGTADRMVKMVTDNAGKQYDPMDVLDRAAKILRPEGGDGASAGMNGMMTLVLNSIQASNDRVLKVYEDQNKAMRDLITLKQNADGSHGPGIVPQKSFIEQAEDYKRIADLFGWSKGAQSTSVSTHLEPPQPAGSSWFNETTAPIIIMGFQTCMVLVANIVHNYAATKIKGMEPQSPGAAVAEANRMMQQSGQGGGGTGAAATTESDQEMRDKETKGWQNFVVQIEKPFLEHFFLPDPKGYTLAAFVMSDGTMREVTENGRANYVAVRRLGAAKFKLYLAGHAPIWSKIQGMPSQVDRFLQEFMDYDKWAAAEADRIKRAGANGHPAATATQGGPGVADQPE